VDLYPFGIQPCHFCPLLLAWTFDKSYPRLVNNHEVVSLDFQLKYAWEDRTWHKLCAWGLFMMTMTMIENNLCLYRNLLLRSYLFINTSLECNGILKDPQSFYSCSSLFLFCVCICPKNKKIRLLYHIFCCTSFIYLNPIYLIFLQINHYGRCT
jgi:hypothetical protein